MYDRSLAISTMEFSPVDELEVLRMAQGLDAKEELHLRCCVCWLPLNDDARCEGFHLQERA